MAPMQIVGDPSRTKKLLPGIRDDNIGTLSGHKPLGYQLIVGRLDQD
jgi:hypothetical protein